MKQVFYSPQVQAVDEMIALLSETFTLVEQAYPHIDVAPARHALEPRRAAHIKPVRLYNGD